MALVIFDNHPPHMVARPHYTHKLDSMHLTQKSVHLIQYVY